MDNDAGVKLKNIAEKVVKKAGLSSDENFGSVVTLLMIVSIILTAIRILQECNKNKTKNMTASDKYATYKEEIKTYSQRRGWFTRMRLKKLLRRELKPDDYAKYSLRLVEALLDIGEEIKDEEVITLVEAANV
jgi:hypothetical protein